MADVELRNVTRRFDAGRAAVDGVSLSVPDGRFLTVLGPSGCGKTTLLRIVAGLERPDSGDVLIEGRVVTDREPGERDVAMVFQSYALYPHMTVFENIAISLKLRKVERASVRAQVEEAAAKLGLSPLLARYPRALSGGERQRVAVARALVRRPRVFLLDEPLSNLDAVLREHARSELKSLFRQIGATVVYVTHDQVEAMTLSDRVAVMNRGRIEQEAPPEEIYARPATSFVAGFVGSPRMNFLPGEGVAATLGVRPEDVLVGEAGEREMSVVSRDVLGAQVLLTLRDGSTELRATVPSDWRPAPTVRVSLNRARIHRFDAEGRRIEP
jgi:ABC-type sugar transport system ATPase subunit